MSQQIQKETCIRIVTAGIHKASDLLLHLLISQDLVLMSTTSNFPPLFLSYITNQAKLQVPLAGP